MNAELSSLHPSTDKGATVAPDPWASIAATLAERGVRQVFGLPDDDMRSLRAFETHGIRVQWCRSQATAVHMAAGSALASGRPHVVIVGRGPGVAATVPALLEACYGHAPVVVIAAAVAPERAGDRAFQDAPTIDLVAPVTRWAARVPTSAQAPAMLREALARSVAVPAGPVYLEIPDPAPVSAASDGVSIDIATDEAFELLRAARRPALLVGGGARALARPQLLALAESLDALVLVTASGRGAFPESHAQFAGVAGLYMSEPVRSLMASCDLVVAIGSHLEETAMTGMPRQAAWLQINADVAGVHHRLPGGHVITEAADWLDRCSGQDLAGERVPWRAAVESLRSRLLAERADEQSLAAQVMQTLSDLIPEDAIVFHENGLHDMWSYSFPHFTLPDLARSVAPSEQTTLGFGVAAAAGAALTEQRLTVCITGDAALGTLRPDAEEVLASRRRLVYVVLDDGAMGWLARQAGAAGSPIRYPRRGGLLAAVDGPDVITIERADQVRGRLTVALSRAGSGRPTVVRVVTAADDVPPMIRGEEDGDV